MDDKYLKKDLKVLNKAMRDLRGYMQAHGTQSLTMSRTTKYEEDGTREVDYQLGPVVAIREFSQRTRSLMYHKAARATASVLAYLFDAAFDGRGNLSEIAAHVDVYAGSVQSAKHVVRVYHKRSDKNMPDGVRVRSNMWGLLLDGRHCGIEAPRMTAHEAQRILEGTKGMEEEVLITSRLLGGFVVDPKVYAGCPTHALERLLEYVLCATSWHHITDADLEITVRRGPRLLEINVSPATASQLEKEAVTQALVLDGAHAGVLLGGYAAGVLAKFQRESKSA